MKKTYVSTKEFLPVIKELLQKQSIKLQVTGSSMMPYFINGKTVVHITPLKKITLRKYDVVLFELNGYLVLHRIVTLGDTIVTQGDALIQKECITEANILGVVSHYNHKNKEIYIRTKKHLFSLRIHLFKKKLKQLIKSIIRKK